jgi:hypothetical protein
MVLRSVLVVVLCSVGFAAILGTGGVVEEEFLEGFYFSAGSSDGGFGCFS